jgi:hypothetical protein
LNSSDDSIFTPLITLWVFFLLSSTKHKILVYEVKILIFDELKPKTIDLFFLNENLLLSILVIKNLFIINEIIKNVGKINDNDLGIKSNS